MKRGKGLATYDQIARKWVPAPIAYPFDFAGLSLFAHCVKSTTGRRFWTVTEASTGHYVVSGYTKAADAIDAAKELITKHGKEVTQRALRLAMDFIEEAK